MIFGGKRREATAEPKHLATPRESHQIAMARIEEARRLARIEAQARFDAEGAPRYAYDVAPPCGCPAGCPMCELVSL